MSNDRTYSFYRKLRPALRLLERLTGRHESAITDLSSNIIDAATRFSATLRKPTKKAVVFTRSDLSRMFLAVMNPIRDGKECNMSHLRALIRANIIYFCFARFADYCEIRDFDITDCNDYLKIYFRKSKNDQMFSGSSSIISKSNTDDCPVKLIRFYYKVCGFKFADSPNLENHKTFFLNFRIKNRDGVISPIPNTVLSRSNSTRDMRNLLRAAEIHDRHYSEKSFKNGEISFFYHEGNASLKRCMIQGRWKNPTTALHYRDDSDEYRLKLAKKMNP